MISGRLHKTEDLLMTWDQPGGSGTNLACNHPHFLWIDLFCCFFFFLLYWKHDILVFRIWLTVKEVM